MPIYEYSCKKCGDFEVTQRMIDEALKKCPTCGAKVTKLISQSAFHLKGSGWYMTDYAKNAANKSGTSSENKTASDTKDTSSSSPSSETSTSPSTKESPSAPKTDSSTTKESSASA